MQKDPPKALFRKKGAEEKEPVERDKNLRHK